MNLTPSKPWVDTHFHVFRAHEAVPHARYTPSYTAALSEWSAQAQDVGVTHGVCVQPSFLGEDNELMLQTVAANLDRLRGVAVIGVDTPETVLLGMHARGVRGIRLNLAGVSHDVTSWAGAEHVWQTMHKLGWHLEVHTDQGALPAVIEQLPTEMTLVVDHMAKPADATTSDPTIQCLVRRARHAQTYIKLSGAYRLGAIHASSLAEIWLHELGASALLWGSDWPCTNHEALANYRDLFSQLEGWVGDATLQAVLADNPKRLYWQDAAVL